MKQFMSKHYLTQNTFYAFEQGRNLTYLETLLL